MQDSGFFMLCNQCGEEVNRSDKICEKCGNVINWDLNKGYTMYCENCSQVIQKGNNRCGNCGNLISYQRVGGNTRQNFGNRENYQNMSNLQFGQNINMRFHNFNWIVIGKTISILILIAYSLLGLGAGWMIGSMYSYDSLFGLIGGLVGLCIGIIFGIVAVTKQMIFIGIAEDVRDIRNKSCN